MLPDEIYRKILLYNIHNNAEILKVAIKAYNDDMNKYGFYDGDFVVDFVEWYSMVYIRKDNPKIYVKREIRIVNDILNDIYQSNLDAHKPLPPLDMSD